ncbi:hypothetical protein K474DRAFT_1178383 [Panus rudis PR-1116 ss-1]|nr:hypothetical protein K474DRAFT_1178383 [Panus rudis PR-1116 ss-1]
MILDSRSKMSPSRQGPSCQGMPWMGISTGIRGYHPFHTASVLTKNHPFNVSAFPGPCVVTESHQFVTRPVLFTDELVEGRVKCNPLGSVGGIPLSHSWLLEH